MKKLESGKDSVMVVLSWILIRIVVMEESLVFRGEGSEKLWNLATACVLEKEMS